MNRASATPSIITSGLLTHLDAANIASYSGSGTTWTDLSGNSRNGTLINGVSYNSSNGGTLVFDGINDYVTATTVTKSLLNRSFTMSLWFNSSSSSNMGLFSIEGNIDDGAPYLILQKNNTTLRWLVNNTYQMTNTILLNTWYNVAITYNGTVWNVYINGALSNSYTGSDVGGGSAYYLFLANGYPAYADVKIPHFVAYNNPLSSTDILNNFNALKSRYGY
jgi:hypothetical protein